MKRDLTLTAANPDDIEFEMRVRLTLRDWKLIREQLWQADRRYSPPFDQFISGIRETVDMAEQTFAPKEPENGQKK